MQLKDIDMAPEELIIKNISDEELDDLLRKEITKRGDADGILIAEYLRRR